MLGPSLFHLLVVSARRVVVAMAMTAEEDAAAAEITEDIRLKAGDKVDGRWQTIRKLGEGAFGAVYEVLDGRGKVKGPKALKVESVRCKDQVLKIEVAVLTAMKGTPNICKLYACGRNEKFNFMIMTLLGPCISNFRKKCHGQKFSKPTTMMITVQCLHALRDMHNVGWLHRDVKPSNFAMGQHDPAASRTVFMLDFGLSRFFFNRDKSVRPPRGLVGFRGTLRYCSINAHKHMDLGRHDDLISLVYMMIEMFTGSVPWKNLREQKQVAAEKEKCAETMYEGLPDGFKDLHQHLYSLLYEDTPPYDTFENVIYQVFPQSKMNDHPFDWEIKRQRSTSRRETGTSRSTAENEASSAPDIIEEIVPSTGKPQEDDNQHVPEMPDAPNEFNTSA